MEQLAAPHLPQTQPPQGGSMPVQWPSNATATAIEQPAPAYLRLPASTGATISDTVTLFELDGREYRVPARPRAVVALRYLRAVRDKGTDVAAAALLTELLGVDGFDALCDYDDLTGKQLKEIMAAATKLTLGSVEEAFGGNSPGSAK
jgi:hypothetical protein